jgi:hypothetical protein
VSVRQSTFRGFANPVDPTPAELRAWAYQPDSVSLAAMPPDWDLLDRSCPARRFALHCLYIYAADAIRTNFKAHPKRRLRKMVEQAEADGDDAMVTWAVNARVLILRPDAFDYHQWCEGGLVRSGRRLA